MKSTKQITITAKPELVDRIKKIAEANNLNFSQFLINTAMKKVKLEEKKSLI